MTSSCTYFKIAIFTALALAFCTAAQADDIVVYQVSLPSGSGINTGSQSTQSDLTYDAGAVSLGSGYIVGGDASNGGSNTWSVDSLSLYVVGTDEIGQTASASFQYIGGLDLYGGSILGGPDSPIGLLGTADTGTQVFYTDGSDNPVNYLSMSDPGTYRAVWQVMFTGLDITMGPGADNAFAVTDASGDSIPLAVTACPGGDANNCVSSGVIAFDQDGANYDLYATYGSAGDVDMILGGVETPEPATWLLLGAGLGVLGLVRRRR